MLIRIRLTTLIAAILAAATAFAGSAFAQGTFGALPDPISSRDLNEYARRLGLSDQQLLAIGEPHARYLEQFRQLRERDIERFFDQFRAPGRWTRFDPSQIGELEPIIKEFNRLMNRIRTLDEAFFGEMQALLTEEQAERVVRIRQHRERMRYRSEATRGVDFLNPAVRVDLSEMIAALDLPPGELDAIDQFMASYESQLTSTSRRVYDSGMKTVLDGLKELDKLGLSEDMLNNPRQVMRLFEQFQQIWNDVAADLLKEADQLTNLNRRTFRQLAAMLQEDSWRLLRERFYGRAYPEAAAFGRSADAHFTAALDMEDVPDDLRRSIQGLAASHMNSQDRLAEQMIDLIEQRRRNLTLMQIAGMGQDATQSKMEEIRTRAQTADESAIETLKAMLGPELAEKLRPSPTAAVRSGRVGMMRVAQGPGGRGAERAQRSVIAGGMHRGAVAFLTENRPPDRVSAAEVRDLANQFNLDAAQVDLLESLHQDYLARFETIRRDYGAPYVRIVEQVRREEGRPDQVQLARLLDEGFALLEALLDAVREAEDRFFDDVRFVVIDAADQAHASILRSVRSARERTRYQVPAEVGRQVPAFAFSSAGEGRVDVADVVASLALETDHRLALAEVLAEYESQATDLMRKRFESELATHRQSLQFVLSRSGGEGGPPRGAAMREMGERMGVMREAARASGRALADLNRETLVGMLDVLPDEVAVQLEDRYYREAFPEAFDDPDSAEHRIQVALALRDLTESQRDRILEIAADYRPLYYDLTYRILDHYMAMSDAPPLPRGGERGRRDRGSDGFAAFSQRMEQASSLEMLNFDRSELNERTIRQLRAILRPDQIERLAHRN